MGELMAILTQSDLIGRLDHLLANSERVDVAVAWASPGKALSRLAKFAQRRDCSLRAIVGIAGTATDPDALRLLKAIGGLRIPDNSPLFHPKLFLFHGRKETKVWVGSANLTDGGFNRNTELVTEFLDDGSALKWFNDCWNALPVDPTPMIDAYEKVRPMLYLKTAQQPLEPTSQSQSQFYRMAENLTGWPSFVEAVRKANKFWAKKLNLSVDGEQASWLHTVALGNALVCRDSWNTLTKQECRVLLGIEIKSDLSTFGYGLLGSMRGAGNAKKVFFDNSEASLEIRSSILDRLHKIQRAESFKEFVFGASDFIEWLGEIKGFSGGVATRLLTLARPDFGISVNGGSQPNLSKMSGIPPSSLSKVRRSGYHRSHSYNDLLLFLNSKEWYSNPSPKNAYEQALSDARGALLDCLVYLPV